MGTNDIREIEDGCLAGEEDCIEVRDAFAYQVAKDIGAMSTVLSGQVDQIILTGGIAYDKGIVEEIQKRTAYIADFTVYKGEDELLALVQGGLRVLNGEEPAMKY